jgi:archaellum biogenesis ATPase FlaH
MNSLLPAAPAPTFNINNLFGGLELRQEDVDLMDEAQFLVENVIVKGHVAAYVSPANGGKTTLFVHLCEELAAGGNIIYYVNVDGSPSDLKRHHAHALKHGYTVVNPSARNQSNSVVMDKLTELAAGTDRLENVVIIIDTLKKFCDLINKSQSKKILEVFRSLSVKGATVCLLGHTNKYKDVNGLEIYEGTSDLRNDVDELIYLDSIKDEVAKTLTITTRPDKVRATFEPISFNVDLEGDRKVTPLQEVVSIFCSEDHKLITLILKVIGGGDSKQQDIIDAVREQSEFSVAKIRSCLIRHRVEGDDYQKWSYELTGFKREYSYKLLPVKEASWFDLDPIATT